MQWLRGRGSRDSGDRGNGDRGSRQNPTPATAERSSRARTNPPRAPPDPFKISGTLFEYLTHVEQHGEAFAGYRVKGNPMVLRSLVDGTALASIHLLMVGDSEGRALVARQPGDNNAFQGVLSAEGQAFELVMMNLTTDAVLMMDIGGDVRHTEPEFWDRNDKEFWSGQHRNDHRLNRSNILWPMVPNVCEENNIHYQETGVSRRLQLMAQASMSTDGVTGRGATVAGFPIFVYPKYGSRAAARFERTAWTCPETIVLVGSPQLLGGDSAESYNIQRDNPLNRGSKGEKPAQEGVAGALADTLGVTAARLLEVAGVDPEFLTQVPDELAHELLMQALDEKKLRALLEEGASDATAQPHAKPATYSAGSTDASPSSGSSAVAGAMPAAVVAGERMLRMGGHNLLIEKFDFGRFSQPATLSFGVLERLQHSDDAVSEDEVATLRGQLHAKLEELCSGRREALLEQICEVYQTPECVICMSEGPDTVLYQCGHRCVHFKCIEKSGLRRCPLCRAPIAAMLPDADGPSATTTSV